MGSKPIFSVFIIFKRISRKIYLFSSRIDLILHFRVLLVMSNRSSPVTRGPS